MRFRLRRRCLQSEKLDLLFCSCSLVLGRAIVILFHVADIVVVNYHAFACESVSDLLTFGFRWRISHLSFFIFYNSITQPHPLAASTALFCFHRSGFSFCVDALAFLPISLNPFPSQCTELE